MSQTRQKNELSKIRLAYYEATQVYHEAGRVYDDAEKVYRKAGRAYREAEQAYHEAAHNEAEQTALMWRRWQTAKLRRGRRRG